MKDKKRYKIIFLLAILIFLPFIAVSFTNEMRIRDKSLVRVEANIISSDKNTNSYSIEVGYTINNRYYQRRLDIEKLKKGQDKISIYYDRNDFNIVNISNKRELNEREKIIIYRLLGIIVLIYSIIIVCLYHNDLKLLVKKEEKKRKKRHVISHYESKKSTSYDEIVILGKIVSVSKKNNNYIMEIEYEYKGDIYNFYIDGFKSDISRAIHDQKMEYVKLYMRYDKPDMIRLDEKDLRKKLEK